MALYALGDLHLNFQTPDKAMDRFGSVWKGRERIFRDNCRRMIREEDTLVLTGDHSWGRKLSDCEKDLEYIASLPGRKILLRGNHDMFWEPNKTEKLNRIFSERYGNIFLLQNNYYAYRDIALVGTKGYTFEGPFYLDRQGHVKGWDELNAVHAEKLVEREYNRLVRSVELARQDGYSKFIVFLHYPPTNILQRNSCFTKLAERIGAEQVIYSHCHGEERFHDSLTGRHHGIRYRLVSGDFLRWKPEKISE